MFFLDFHSSNNCIFYKEWRWFVKFYLYYYYLTFYFISRELLSLDKNLFDGGFYLVENVIDREGPLHCFIHLPSSASEEINLSKAENINDMFCVFLFVYECYWQNGSVTGNSAKKYFSQKLLMSIYFWAKRFIRHYIILKNGILKSNCSVFPQSEGYISQYTP